jgi:acyl-CoA thioester hydrolase
VIAVECVLQHRVRYHEADAQGFLFNSRFLELADVAMTEFFRRHGYPYSDLLASGTDPSVVSAQIQFKRPARFDDLLDVSVACPRVGNSSFDLFVSIARDGATVGEILLTYVNVDAATETSRALPASVAEALVRSAQV